MWKICPFHWKYALYCAPIRDYHHPCNEFDLDVRAGVSVDTALGLGNEWLVAEAKCIQLGKSWHMMNHKALNIFVGFNTLL